MKKRKRDTVSQWEALKFLNQFLDGIRIKFVLFYFGWLLDTLLGIVTPVLFGTMINEIVYYSDMPSFLKMGAIFFAVSCFSAILYYWLYDIYDVFWCQILSRVRFRIYQVMQRMDAEEMTNTNTGDLLDLIQNRVYECVNFIVRAIIHNLNNFLSIIVCFVLVFRINPWIGILMVTIAPVSVFLSWKFGKREREEKYQNQLRYGDYIGWLYEMFASLKDIRLLGAENHVVKLFRKQQNDLMNSDVKAGITALKSDHFIAGINTVIQMCLFALLAYFSVKENLTIGSVVVVLTYFDKLRHGFEKVSNTYMNTQYQLSVITRIKKAVEKPTAENWPGTHVLDTGTKSPGITFEKIQFAYRNREPVVRDFSLPVRAGEKIALVGESGCGKSTLAYLLLGFYQPQKGKIFIDGVDVSEYTLASLRQNIGIVQQEVLIFDGTIRENIMFGNENASEEEFINACRAAGVYDFVMELKEGFDTVLGKRGRQLSGGQKQRISIARVYLKNPAILIFDEATASLDNETEAMIHEAWKSVLKNRTAIIIAHRQSAVELCDRVALMQEGKIVEIDTPESLRVNSERYRTLFAI